MHPAIAKEIWFRREVTEAAAGIQRAVTEKWLSPDGRIDYVIGETDIGFSKFEEASDDFGVTEFFAKNGVLLASRRSEAISGRALQEATATRLGLVYRDNNGIPLVVTVADQEDPLMMFHHYKATIIRQGRRERVNYDYVGATEIRERVEVVLETHFSAERMPKIIVKTAARDGKYRLTDNSNKLHKA